VVPGLRIALLFSIMSAFSVYRSLDVKQRYNDSNSADSVLNP